MLVLTAVYELQEKIHFCKFKSYMTKASRKSQMVYSEAAVREIVKKKKEKKSSWSREICET